jgi:hypothetical protein
MYMCVCIYIYNYITDIYYINKHCLQVDGRVVSVDAFLLCVCVCVCIYIYIITIIYIHTHTTCRWTCRISGCVSFAKTLVIRVA